MTSDQRFGGQKEVISVRKSIAAVAIAGSMLAGGVAGAVLYGAAAVAPSIAASAATTAASPAPGVFQPNEDPAHEATESTAREAQENAGQRPTVP
jgi:hypothetical protein